MPVQNNFAIQSLFSIKIEETHAIKVIKCLLLRKIQIQFEIHVFSDLISSTTNSYLVLSETSAVHEHCVILSNNLSIIFLMHKSWIASFIELLLLVRKFNHRYNKQEKTMQIISSKTLSAFRLSIS